MEVNFFRDSSICGAVLHSQEPNTPTRQNEKVVNHLFHNSYSDLIHNYILLKETFSKYNI